MDLDGIKSSDKSINDLFGGFYTVPDYQREYVWKTEQVERLLSDLSEEYAREPSSNYFVGTIVTNSSPTSQVSELIDGQQRVTTFYVALIAIRDFLIRLESPQEAIEQQLYALSVDKDGNEKRRHRVELQYEDSQDVLIELVKQRNIRAVDEIETPTPSAQNLINTYRIVWSFLDLELTGEAAQIKKFYAYITQEVKLILIRTESLDRALWIFETINERGSGLDAMDLLKNLLFRTATEDNFENLKRRWKALIDTLNRHREKPIGFIRYYLLARYSSKKIQARSVYTWLTDPKNEEKPNYQEDPTAFANELLIAAQAYVAFGDGQLADGTECRYLKNIWHLAHTAKQHLILMLAAAQLPNEAQIMLAKEIENLFFVYFITKRQTNVFENEFVIWANSIREMKTTAELDEYIHNIIRPKRIALSDKFEFSIRSLRENDLPRYRLRYMLAKYAQHLDEIAYGEQDISQYINSGIDIEHILSITAIKESIDEFGGEEIADEYRHRLSNLTLLERPHNAFVSNKPFAEKIEGYSQSRILLTKGIAGGLTLGKDTKVNKALEYVHPYESWDKESFLDRENCLVQLAHQIWDTEKSGKNGDQHES